MRIDPEQPFLPETLVLHGGGLVRHKGIPPVPPLYQRTGYVYNERRSVSHSTDMLKLGDTYSRILNPTTDLLEQRLSSLEQGAGALALASGQSALSLALLCLLDSGDELVSTTDISPSTYNFFNYTLPNLGIKVKFVEDHNPASFTQAMTKRTKAIFAELLGHVQLEVLDIQAVAKIAQAEHLPFIVDNTMASPYLVNPVVHGANIVIHSAMRLIGGHGTSVGGVIIDGGNFDWDKARYPQIGEVDSQKRNSGFDVGKLGYIINLHVQLLRQEGPALSAFNSFLLLQGLETLHLRMERHSENALQVAQYLSNHPQVSWVDYPGLRSHPNYERNQKYFTRGLFGGFIGFGLEGGNTPTHRFIENLQLHSLKTQLGDPKSAARVKMAAIPYRLEDQQSGTSASSTEFIRLSVGLENIQDIITDLDRAFHLT